MAMGRTFPAVSGPSQSECPDSPWHCPACLTNGPSSADSSSLNSDSSLLSDHSTSPPSILKKPNLRKCKNSSADSDRYTSLPVYYTNCSSFLPKMDDLRMLAEEQQPDIIFLCETWLGEDIRLRSHHPNLQNLLVGLYKTWGRSDALHP